MRESFLDASWHRVASLQPRLRGHVQVHRHRYRGQSWYIVDDQASGRTHRFTPAVYQFVGLMDGQRTVQEIWQSVVEDLGDDAPSQGEVIRLLSQLAAADLLQTDVAPDAVEMAERHAKYTAARRRGSFGNPLAIRLPLADPDRFLLATEALVRPIFSRAGAALWLAAVVPALILAGIHWNELTDSIADRVFAVEGLILTLMLFPVLKLIHELGHAYATKIGGGDVHEMGVMLLVFAPVPYVDASASIAFRSKWRRILVGGAGMIAELFVAALATFVWVLAEPGMVRSIAFHTMLIAGVSTVVFNANPLLRFDGYYMLCDLIEMPNLGIRSSRYWGSLIERRVFGVRDTPPPSPAFERFWLALYAPLSFVYRVFVSIGIALFIASAYFFIGVITAIWAIVGGFVVPIWKALKHVLTSPRLEQRRWRAVSITAGGIAVLAAGLCLVPVPLHTLAEGVVWLPEESYLRASDAGFVKSVRFAPGTTVSAGEIVMQTEEFDLATRLRVLEAEIAGLRSRLAGQDFTDLVQADLTRQEIAVKQLNLTRMLERAEAMQIRSASDGIFLAPAAADLPGRFVKRGDLLGYVIGQGSRTTRIVVTQDNIELVRNRLSDIAVRFVHRPGEAYPARLVREVPAASYGLPSKALTEAGGGRFVSDPRDSNQTKTLQRTFQFDLELPPEAANSNFGSRVLVKFGHGYEPLANQGYRRLRQLFLSHFEV